MTGMRSSDQCSEYFRIERVDLFAVVVDAEDEPLRVLVGVERELGEQLVRVQAALFLLVRQFQRSFSRGPAGRHSYSFTALTRVRDIRPIGCRP